MPKETFYPTVTGAKVRHVCKKPGLKPGRVRRIKRNITLSPDAITIGEELAKEEGVSLSRLIEKLILKEKFG